MNLKNKVAVVTGASDGIGKQVALKLAERGVHLALIGRDKIRLESVKKEAIKNSSKKVEIYSCDIRDKKLISQTVSRIISDFKEIDILLNIAGVWQKLGPLDSIDDDSIDEVIGSNLTGLIRITSLFLPYLKKQREAIIINVSSKSGVVAQEGQSVYTASKYGVRGFTEVLKVDLKGSSVRVAGVYQSGTNTKMFEKAGDKPPVEKFTEPEDLADVIVYMLSRPEKIWLHEVQVEY